MENTKFIYAANSDLDDELFYAEFETKDEAINYAMDHLDKLPFVDEIELAYDTEGTEDAISYKTIWDHTMAVQDEVAAAEDEDEAFWDFSIAQEAEAQANKYDLGDTTWFESLNNLVEDMEENEDMVECKECFDLFPKDDCIKLAFGYVCPHCNGGAAVADDDIFKVEFPEYKKFSDTADDFDDSKLAMSDADVDRVNEPFEEPFSSNDSVETESEPELTAEEAVPFLVNDEVEAVAGYEKAAEVVADSDLANKEEILDTIDHIKEEEEEHIEELNDLVDDEIIEIENETTSEIAKEDEVEEIEDPEPTPLTEDTNSETRYWICFYDGLDVAVIEAADEEEANEIFVNDYSDEYFFDSWDRDWSVEEISKEEYDEWENSNSLFAHLNLPEHINKKCATVESDQKLEGTDNAVVDCKVADIVTHSEDEKPLHEEFDRVRAAAQCSKKCYDFYNAVSTNAPKKEVKKHGKVAAKFVKDQFGLTGKQAEDLLISGYAVWRLLNGKSKHESLTEATAAEFDEIVSLCKEIGIETGADLDRFAKEEVAEDEKLLDRLRSYRAELGDDFKIRESLYNFTEEEMAEYNIDEDGVSLNSYDEYVRCNWCSEIYTADQCVFEADLGWLCDRCYSAIRTRGEKLTILTNPTDEEIARTLEEEVKMTVSDLKKKFN